MPKSIWCLVSAHLWFTNHSLLCSPWWKECPGVSSYRPWSHFRGLLPHDLTTSLRPTPNTTHGSGCLHLSSGGHTHSVSNRGHCPTLLGCEGHSLSSLNPFYEPKKEQRETVAKLCPTKWWQDASCRRQPVLLQQPSPSRPGHVLTLWLL